MEHSTHFALRESLLASLRNIYRLKAFGTLAELLQGEALILQYLKAARGSGPVYPSVLSEQLHLSRSRITGALNSLQRKEFVTLEPSPEDRRRVRVAITEAGCGQIDRQIEQMLAYFDRMLDGLGEQDARTLIALMDRCVAIMGA